MPAGTACYRAVSVGASLRTRFQEHLVIPEAHDRPAVVFDIGGVILDWNPRHLYRKLCNGDDAVMERFLDTVCTAEWNAQQDAGRPLAEATRRLVEQHPDHEVLIRAYYDRWDEMLVGEVAGTADILTALSNSGVAVYGLTNWSAETFPSAVRRFPVLGLLSGIVVSGEERLVKPDPAIFAVLEGRFGLQPARTTFIDDSTANVEAARSLGYDAIRFTTAAVLRTELRRRGLLTGPAR
jgi:2-haloacid dehalogenase